MVSVRFAYAIRFEVTVQQTTAETTTTIRMWIILFVAVKSTRLACDSYSTLSLFLSLLHTWTIRTLHRRYLSVYKYISGQGKRAKFTVIKFQVFPSASSIICTHGSVYLRKQFRKALKILYIEHKEEKKKRGKGWKKKQKHVQNKNW